MALFACISTLVFFICQPVMDALQSSLQTAARDLFTFLRDWTAGEINSRLFSRPSPAEEVPVSSAQIIGAEQTLQEIQSYLNDDTVAVIGICGMGGIGKTTLLKKINNDFCKSGAWGMFDLVIWVTVSQEINIPKIQKQIGDRLGLSFSESDQSAVEKQAKLLFKELSKKRFLLLLDDLWAMLELVTIGIPIPKGRRNCKMAFTTRSEQVCSDMDADKSVSVRLLDGTRSWELFCSKVRTEAVLKSPAIKPLAKQVVQKCGGLPLSLITVGRAMANRKHPNEWKHAIKALDRSATELHGMDQVISALKFSYDYLENDKMRSALLFCAMYPEDNDIRREELIEYWVGEGLLDGEDVSHDVDTHIDDARDRGHVLISDLQAACLLETGIRDWDETVRMHDAVRSMALWLNSHEIDKVDGFLVCRGNNPMVGKVQGREHLIRRIWMNGSDLSLSLPLTPDFPNICTLRLNGVRFEQKFKPSSFLQGYFDFMRTLHVLDLSPCFWVKELPVEIGLLAELRYLNLSVSFIRSVPVELGKLVKLRQLLWEDLIEVNQEQTRIPREAIVGLSSLQVLHMAGNDYDWNTHGRMIRDSEREGEDQLNSTLSNDVAGGGSDRQLELDDLQVLERLQDLHIQLDNSQSLERFLRSDALRRCTKYLCLRKNRDVRRHRDDWLYGTGGALLRMVVSRMGGYLRRLELYDDHVHPWEGNLQFNLNELPCLESLALRSFNKEMKVVIVGTGTNTPSNGDVEPTTNQCLRTLLVSYSHGVKELKFVGRFPHLEGIRLESCKGIEKVVLDDDDDDDDRIRTAQEEREDICHFPMLKEMNLRRQLALKSIGHRSLLLPSLETLRIWECPQLRRLPLSPTSAPKLKDIRGQQAWWDALGWGSSDGLNVKTIFEPFFVSLDE